MKLFFLISISLLNMSIFFAQENNLCGEINYTQVINITSVFEQKFSLKFTNKQSLYEEINIKSTNDKTNKSTSEKGLTNTIIVGRANKISNFFYNEINNFYFRHVFLNEVLLVKEDMFKWVWDLQPETKTIGTFVCQKATIKFRGRNYIAWFTNEIPVPFGPWKFQGLSGLILEVYDEAKEFHIYTDNIKIENKVCTIDIDKNQFIKTLNIDEYLLKKEELLNDYFVKLASKAPKGVKPAKYDKNCEDCPKPLELFDEKN